MTVEKEVLEALIKYDMFHNEDSMVPGIAQKAIDTDFDKLSEKQKSVLQPFMKIECVGINNPGGHHNNCQNVLEGKELVNALDNSLHYGAIICEDCRNEEEGYTREWEKIQAQ